MSSSSCFSLILFLFAAFTFLHLISNYMAVTSVVMETLNQARLSILVKEFLKSTQALSVQEANYQEPVIFSKLLSYKFFKSKFFFLFCDVLRCNDFWVEKTCLFLFSWVCNNCSPTTSLLSNPFGIKKKTPPPCFYSNPTTYLFSWKLPRQKSNSKKMTYKNCEIGSFINQCLQICIF